MPRKWKIYLSGEIHTNWRNKLTNASKKVRLPVEFFSPVTNHRNSDECGIAILGNEAEKIWKDHKGAKINAIRTRTLIEDADIVIVRFGEKYKQWNAAFDAGYAAALGIPLIIQHAEDHIHALKEVDASALAVAQTVEQVVKILKYVVKGRL